MPGFIGNYQLPSTTHKTALLNTLGCKLVTSFEANSSRVPELPSIMATIMLFSAETGKLSAIVEGTEITKWRTAAASLVATQQLYFNRQDLKKTNLILSIVGCGVQGEIHALAFASYFENIQEIRFYNRTQSKRDSLVERMNLKRADFKNPQLSLTKCHTPSECVQNADLVVIATNSDVPLIKKEDLKEEVHINGKFN